MREKQVPLNEINMNRLYPSTICMKNEKSVRMLQSRFSFDWARRHTYSEIGILKKVGYAIGLACLLYGILRLSVADHKGAQALRAHDLQIIPSQSVPWDHSIYFDTQFLNNAGLVAATLKEEGFTHGYFTTQDGTRINYLFGKRADATCTLIACGGWFPGKKEGLASLYKLIPESCNLLLFDARGHGGSDGYLFSSLLRYGQHEYKDVMAAIEFTYAQTGLPSIIFGLCAGAFHSVHALTALKNHPRVPTDAVAGLVFDSGWGSLMKTSRSVPKAKIRDVIKNSLAKIWDKKTIECSRLFNGMMYCADLVYDVCHYCLYKPFVDEKNTNIADKIADVSVPVLFVHATDDAYVCIDEVKKLADRVPCKQCWWIDQPSRHARNHLKHKHAYKEKLAAFITQSISS